MMTDDQLFGEIDWFEEREKWISKVDSLERFIEYKGLSREYFEWKGDDWMSEKRCIIASMKKGIKENPTLKKYLDKMVSDGIDEDTALEIMILAWQNRRQNDEWKIY